MKEQKDNSKLIITLAMLWGFSLVFAQFSYFLGITDGVGAAMDAMMSFMPTSVAILMLSWAAGTSLAKSQRDINISKRKFVFLGILCLLFFPIGLIFLFSNFKYKELKS